MPSTTLDQFSLDVLALQTSLARPILVAVDGRSGSGKTHFSQQLAERVGGCHVVADDFWVGGAEDEWRRRTPRERAAGPIDWRRLRADVPEPLLRSEPASWRPFDWEAGIGLSERTISCAGTSVIVLDGAYSSRPELADLVDVSLLLVVDDATRRSRLRAREGEERMAVWHETWDVAEDHYFEHVRPRELFDAVIETD
jgi:para-aminobenzoate synthetase